MYNINQPYRPDWVCPIQNDPYPQFYDPNFQNNFHFSRSQWGFTAPKLDYQSPCPPSSFQHFALHTPFSELPIEEKLELQKSMEAMLETQNNLKS